LSGLLVSGLLVSVINNYNSMTKYVNDDHHCHSY
jgi:hypothetical protein